MHTVLHVYALMNMFANKHIHTYTSIHTHKHARTLTPTHLVSISFLLLLDDALIKLKHALLSFLFPRCLLFLLNLKTTSKIKNEMQRNIEEQCIALAFVVELF